MHVPVLLVLLRFHLLRATDCQNVIFQRDIDILPLQSGHFDSDRDFLVVLVYIDAGQQACYASVSGHSDAIGQFVEEAIDLTVECSEDARFERRKTTAGTEGYESSEIHGYLLMVSFDLVNFDPIGLHWTALRTDARLR